ncbi:MAG: Alpha-aminoadipate carrier protein LysW [Candidatus Aminicenantes bacterium ADurb.Bin508]|nr:MAG: Alpha-aminoadipate carrier protein LysW [Candidatus Aminicenantes bacterium ADurb.Bin508]HPB56138.1 lysine biosynthesis protein LysW [Candidatus Aminicenantes bacterium]
MERRCVCPVCESEISLPEDSRVHEVYPCPECRCEMEILSLEPLIVEEAPQVEEDWGQ